VCLGRPESTALAEALPPSERSKREIIEHMAKEAGTHTWVLCLRRLRREGESLSEQ